jgi:hypothetical protein
MLTEVTLPLLLASEPEGGLAELGFELEKGLPA